MKRTKPPFRADMVGSLLRTAPLKQARDEFQHGAISADALKSVEDREIRSLIRRQEEIGLQAVTDGGAAVHQGRVLRKGLTVTCLNTPAPT